MPRVLDPTSDAIAAAGERLRAGGVVAFPTETVYGLGADTFNEGAIESVFALKGRVPGNPLSAHVLGVEQAQRVVSRWDGRCESLAERFWPGPLALVLPKRPEVPDVATGGRATVGVRCPRHEAASALLRAVGGPISAPSANRSGGVSPTSADHVADDFADIADLMILDGGRCEIGIESTVLDLSGAAARILRPGSVSATELREVLGEVEGPEAPGAAGRQYAPRTPMELVPSGMLADRLAGAGRCVVLCFRAIDVHPPHEAIEMPQGAGEYAARMYDALRSADAAGVERIFVERPPETNEMWRSVGHRLHQAAGGG